MSELPPRAEVIDALKFAVAPAAGAAAVVYLGAALVLSRFSADWRRAMPAVSVLALAAAVAAGNHFREALPWLPRAAWWHWVGPAILGSLAVEVVARTWGVSSAVGHLLRGLAAGIVAATVTPPDWQAESRWVFPLVAVVLAAEWATLVAVGERIGGGATCLAMAVVAAGAGAVLLHNHSLGFTDLATFMQVGLFALAVLAWLTRSDASAAAAVAVVPVLSVLLLSRFLSESQVRYGCFLAVGLAPLGLGLLLVRRVGPVTAAVLAVLLVAGPVGWAVRTAAKDEPLKFTVEEKW